MRLVTLTIALSLLVASGCGTPVAATDAAGMEGACASECAGESECSMEEKAECAAEKAECAMEEKADCASKCEGAEATTN